MKTNEELEILGVNVKLLGDLGNLGVRVPF